MGKKQAEAGAWAQVSFSPGLLSFFAVQWPIRPACGIGVSIQQGCVQFLAGQPLAGSTVPILDASREAELDRLVEQLGFEAPWLAGSAAPNQRRKLLLRPDPVAR